MSPKIPKSIALVDFMHMLTVHFKAMASDAGPNDAGQRTLNELAAIRQASDHVIVCMDSPPYWRKTVFPGYKAGREREPEFGAIVKWTIERLHADGYNVAAAPTEEADDVAACLATIYSEEYGCEDVRIVGADKDALQLVTDQVRCFVPKGRGEFEIRGIDWVLKHFGGVDWEAEAKKDPSVKPIEPKDIALALAIMGDTSDKIPGIKGIGIKNAARLINAYKNPEGMAVACVARVQAAKVTGKLPALWKNYAEGMADLPKWLKLTTLKRDVALEKHPLKYLEKLPMQKLVDDDEGTISFIDEGELEDAAAEAVDWDAIAAETEAREREALAAALPVSAPPGWPQGGLEPPVDPVKLPDGYQKTAEPGVFTKTFTAEPRIGKDPKADEHLKRAADERKRERPPEQVAADNAKEASRVRPDGRTQAQALEDERIDRHGVKRPDPTVLDPMRNVPAESQEAIRGLAERTGKEAAAATVSAATATPSAPAASAAPAAAEVVPKSQGPRKGDEIPQPTDLIRVPAPSWALATQPSSAAEMLAVSKTLFNSRFYSQYGSERGVFAVMALGRELAMGFAESLESFFIVNERPFMKAVTILARAQKHPDSEWMFVTSAVEKLATIKTKHRRAGDLEYQYTIERAAKAGYLTGKNKFNWETKTQEMLEARAISKGVRRWYPGVCFGMHAFEEANDD